LEDQNVFSSVVLKSLIDGFSRSLVHLILGSTYSDWLVCIQVKKDYIEGLNDSLDLVPIGAWYGQGRKVSPSLFGEDSADLSSLLA
jgi:hypothetical protein